MNRYERLEKKVSVYDDVLPEEVYNALLDKYENKPEVDRVNKTAWAGPIISETGVVLINDIDKKITIDIAKAIMEKSDFFTIGPKEEGEDVDAMIQNIFQYGYNMMFYRWTPLSYIPVHSDYGLYAAATIYLNKDYDITDGGVYMYKTNEEDSWTAVEPKFNRMVVVQGDTPHWSTPNTSKRNRLSLQMFSDVAKEY
tara:strand:+ start:550 stop:1140 length:591 start_codon:yes stop_codon:yes gene_type:complete